MHPILLPPSAPASASMPERRSHEEPATSPGDFAALFDQQTAPSNRQTGETAVAEGAEVEAETTDNDAVPEPNETAVEWVPPSGMAHPHVTKTLPDAVSHAADVLAEKGPASLPPPFRTQESTLPDEPAETAEPEGPPRVRNANPAAAPHSGADENPAKAMGHRAERGGMPPGLDIAAAASKTPPPWQSPESAPAHADPQRPVASPDLPQHAQVDSATAPGRTPLLAAAEPSMADRRQSDGRATAVAPSRETREIAGSTLAEKAPPAVAQQSVIPATGGLTIRSVIPAKDASNARNEAAAVAAMAPRARAFRETTAHSADVGQVATAAPPRPKGVLPPSFAPLILSGAAGTAPPDLGGLSPLLDSSGAHSDLPLPAASQSSAHVLHLTARPELPAPVARLVAEALQAHPGRGVEITLSPEDLGRVRFSLTTAEGAITVHVLTERADTLDLMRRNIEQLGQEFRALGYGDIAFSFASHDQSNHTQDDGAQSAPWGTAGEPDSPAEIAIALPLGPTEGLDLRL